MIRALLAFPATLALALLAACGDGNGGQSAGSPSPGATASETAVSASDPARCEPARPAPGGRTSRTLMAGGIERRYLLYVAQSYDGTTPRPLLVSFHGLGQPADLQLDTGAFETLADAQGLIVVAPVGVQDPVRWNNTLQPDGPDDVAFIRDLLDAVSAELCIDQDAVFAAGYSNGAGMAQRLACAMPDRIAAIALVAGQYVDCVGTARVIMFHGTADPVLPYDGGETPMFPGFSFLPARRVASEWARGLGCDGLAQIERESTEIEVSRFVACPLGTDEVILYTVIGGGHTWPGTAVVLPESIVGRTTTAISATELLWDFFALGLDPAAPAPAGDTGDERDTGAGALD